MPRPSSGTGKEISATVTNRLLSIQKTTIGTTVATVTACVCYPRISEELAAGVQLSTGGNEFTSRNETFDDVFSADDIRLNEAFITYAPAFLGGGVTVQLGKRDVAKTLVVVRDLVYDSDITLEGVSLQYGKDVNGKEKSGFGAVLGYYPLNELKGPSSDEQDAYLVAAQISYKGKSGPVAYQLGAGYYDTVHFDYLNTGSSYKPLFDYRGKDFNVAELFASVSAPLTPALPLKVYDQYAFNTASHDANRYSIDDSRRDAWLLGLQVGSAADPGGWSVSGEYVSIERDAVSVLTDSDRNNTLPSSTPTGTSTDLEGFKLSALYHAVNNMTLGANYYRFTRMDSTDPSYHLFQADVVVKF